MIISKENFTFEFEFAGEKFSIDDGGVLRRYLWISDGHKIAIVEENCVNYEFYASISCKTLKNWLTDLYGHVFSDDKFRCGSIEFDSTGILYFQGTNNKVNHDLEMYYGFALKKLMKLAVAYAKNKSQ